MAITYNQTFTKTCPVEKIRFGNLSLETLIELFKDGRVFSHFIERDLELDYPIKHVPGCRDHDFIDLSDESIKYDQKTFTEHGCDFTPSNMKGQGRKFDKAVFDEKSRHLTYIIVSNVNFPEIKVRFVKGDELSARYPRGVIALKDHDAFFS